jgi:hypothetical protein
LSRFLDLREIGFLQITIIFGFFRTLERIREHKRPLPVSVYALEGVQGLFPALLPGPLVFARCHVPAFTASQTLLRGFFERSKAGLPPGETKYVDSEFELL